MKEATRGETEKALRVWEANIDDTDISECYIEYVQDYQPFWWVSSEKYQLIQFKVLKDAIKFIEDRLTQDLKIKEERILRVVRAKQIYT